MQIDIAAHIEKLLFEHETLIVPGFGGFTATRAAAAVDFVGGTVAPPAKSLAFNENLTVDDGILVHDVAHAHGVGNDEARAAIQQFVDSTKEALGRREIVTFAGIGRLYKNYAQKIQFLPDTTNFNTESYGLPPLQFSPLARARETNEAVPSASASSTATQAPPTAAPPPPPATAPAPPTSVPKPQSPPPVVERTQVGNSPLRSMTTFIVALLVFALAVSLYLMKRNRDARAAAQEAVVETPAEQTPAPSSVLPGPGNLIAEAERAAASEKSATAQPAPGIEKEADDTADEVEEAAAKRAQATENQSKNPSPASDEDVAASPQDGKRCVLIIGTYQKKENATKLLDKLKATGWDTYYRLQKGHQVGVEFQYRTMSDIQEKIKQLQADTGEDDIWIKRK